METRDLIGEGQRWILYTLFYWDSHHEFHLNSSVMVSAISVHKGGQKYTLPQLTETESRAEGNLL